MPAGFGPAELGLTFGLVDPVVVVVAVQAVVVVDPVRFETVVPDFLSLVEEVVEEVGFDRTVLEIAGFVELVVDSPHLGCLSTVLLVVLWLVLY